MSIGTRRDMTKKIDAYFTPTQGGTDDELTEVAFNAVAHEFSKVLTKRHAPISFRKAMKLIPQDTSPGYPLTRMGYSQKRQCFGIIQRMNIMKSRWRRNLRVVSPPCMAGVRNQLCKIGENKPRLTWVYPLEVTLIEATFALPLFEHLKRSTFLAWDVKWHSGGAGVIARSMSHGGTEFGKDISGLDASVLESRIRRSFQLIRCYVAFTEPWHTHAWKHMVDYFVNTWIIMYDKAYFTSRGIPSGSYWTQIIGSIETGVATFDTIHLLAYKRGFIQHSITTFSDLFSFWKFLGDDSLLRLKFYLLNGDFNLFSIYMLERHNHVVHPEKGFENLDPDDSDEENLVDREFLGMKLVSTTDITVPTDRLIAQMSIPESEDSSPADALVRLLGLAYSHGTDLYQHLLIKREFERLSREYPHEKLVIKKGAVRDYLTYVLNMDVKNIPTAFPSYQSITYRYRGSQSICLFRDAG